MRQPRVLPTALFATLLTGCVATIPMTPDNLKPPSTQVLALQTHAIGVQIYECRAGKENAGRYEWAFIAPEADLFDSAGIKVGKHYAGPTWEAIDGSKVVGEVKARDDGPDPKAIPWLLLGAKSTAGDGMLSRTTSIQRLQTKGGNAPADCDQTQAGKQVRVPYEATYFFYVTKR